MKQRIIGALVLVSLAVIFVPMIFDEPHSERQSTPINIPEEPPFPEVEMSADEPSTATAPEPQGADDVAPVADNQSSEGEGYRIVEEPAEAEAAAAQPESEPEPESTVTDTGQGSTDAGDETASAPGQTSEDATTPDAGQKADFSDSLAGAWVVQLGSFGKEDNARRLRDKVVEMGYGGHLQQVGDGESRLTRVFSGPFVDKSDAQKAKARLDEAFGLNSLVTSGDRVAGQ
ncbi:DedD protein [Marinobacter oulmenensis]|uniref:DedD protein n=1 Tax=Marinobacter oulmenensis TaxID=643747 RepID=A0A840UIN1_9GAMM|nr:SPOR domain-containing protein [Marinobacter oulmenensis]MBB5320638.1 DedD protein [Marinobacter oulmenensis]